MKFYYLIHTMYAQRGANAIKIISVAIGLLVSCLLFASLAYNHSYNRCFGDYKQLYQVWTTTYAGDEVWGPHNGTVGKLAGGITDEIGDGVTATSFSDFFMSSPLYRDGTRFDVPILVCDSLFFETMGIRAVGGVPRKDLAQPGVVYLSEETAEKIFGSEEVAGQTLVYGDGEVTLTVRGVYPDLPQNVTIPRPGAIVSNPTAMQLGYDRWYNWQGNDGWQTCIRFPNGYKVDEAEMSERINALGQRHAPDKDGWKIRYSVFPVNDTYLKSEKVKNRNTVMWVLGIALLFMTTLNYVLITIASLSRRAKGIGVHKCSGATNLSIAGMFLGETAIVLGAALLLMTALLLACEPLVEQLVGLTVAQIVAPQQLWAVGCGILFFFLVGGLLPAVLFTKIPVTQVFRRFTDKNSAWKRSLLFIQIAGVAFVGGLLSVLSGQYGELVTHDMGFSIRNRAIIDIPTGVRNRAVMDVSSGVPVKGEALLAAVKSLPYVEMVGSGDMLPTSGYAGQGIHADDESEEFKILFMSRLTWTHDGYYDVMEIPLVKGRVPAREDEVVVNEEFVRQMYWGDEPLGKVFGRKTFSQPLTVVGVTRDYALRGFVQNQLPILHAYSSEPFSGYGILKLREPFDDNYRKLEQFLTDKFPGCDFQLTTMEQKTRDLYKELLTTRNSALVATISLIIIAMMGLVGFTVDEVERRRKEIAIRKVNGATAGTVISLVCGDVLKIGVPAVILGTAAAWYVGCLWIQEFTITVEHLPAYFLLSALVILAFVVLCVAAVTRRVANENPVNQLKSE